MAECCVCFRKYDRYEHKPRSLPCGHALCQQCVHAADAVRTQGAADNNPYQPLGCPLCRHPVPDWLALPVNHPVLEMLEQQFSSTRDDSGEPQLPLIDSTEMVHMAPSTAQQIAGSSTYTALQDTDSVMMIAHHVNQLYSPEVLQQLQAVTALAEQTALAAQEGPFAALAADSSELERQQAVCRQIADAGGFAGLVAALLQTHGQNSASAATVQRLGTRVLCSLLFSLPERFQSAVNAGVVRALQQLLGCPLDETQCLAMKTLLALAASSEPTVQAAVLQLELYAPATALLKSDDTVVQLDSIALLQLLLREHQQAPAAAAAAAPAVVALTRLLGNHNVEVQQAAYLALWAFISRAGPGVVAQQVAVLLGQSCSSTQLAGLDWLIGLLTHLSKMISVQELSSAGVVEASVRLLGSLEPAVQAAAAQAAAALSFNPEGVAVLVSIPQGVQQLVALLGVEGTQESAASALRGIAENSIMPWQLEAVRSCCGAEIRAAGAVPAALDLLRSSLDPGSTQRPSDETVRSLLLMLQCCSMRPDAAAVIRQAGGLEVMQQVLMAHPEAEWQHPGIMPSMSLQPFGGALVSHSQGPKGQSALAGQAGGIQLETSSMEPSDAITADHFISYGELELGEPIEEGAGGKVYRGKWCGVDIAAKEYRAVDDDGQTEWTRQEVGILAKLAHPNLVRFCGVCLDPPLLVMEYYKSGSMFKMLGWARAAVQHGQTNEYVNYLTWKRRLQMLHDVASGMLYLHSRRHVHGDLSSLNMFVAEGDKVKVGDITNRLKRSKELLGRPEPIKIRSPRWAAPELLGDTSMSTASDVYSFGIVMYEMLTLKMPFEECDDNGMVAIRVLTQAMRPQIPTFHQLPPNTSRICLANYIRLMQECWQQDPQQRPSFATVARRLKAMQHWVSACSNALLHTSSTNTNSSSGPSVVPLAEGFFTVPPSDPAAEAAAAERAAHAARPWDVHPAVGDAEHAETMAGEGREAAADHPHFQQQQQQNQQPPPQQQPQEQPFNQEQQQQQHSLQAACPSVISEDSSSYHGAYAHTTSSSHWGSSLVGGRGAYASSTCSTSISEPRGHPRYSGSTFGIMPQQHQIGPDNRMVPVYDAIPEDMLQQEPPVWQHPGVMPGLQMHPLDGQRLSHDQSPMADSPLSPGPPGQEGGYLLGDSLIERSDTIRAEHIISCEELQLDEPIGIGPERKVYRGKWCGITIAAKEFLAVDDSKTEWTTERASLLSEVDKMTMLTHPNLVRFCGVCLDPPLLVMEYYKNGSMFKMLERARAAVQQGQTNKYVNYLSWKRRLQMLHDVACGMMYLQSRRHVHGDLRSPNLLVTDNGRVKLGGFGFTQCLPHMEETIKVARITHPRWVAPELLGDLAMSTASDVYSFGIFMYEMLTFKIPFEEYNKDTVPIKVLVHAARPQIPTFDQLPPNTSRICLANYIRLMQDCWQQDPKQRPSFATVARRLKAIQHWFLACSSALHISSLDSDSSKPMKDASGSTPPTTVQDAQQTALTPAPSPAGSTGMAVGDPAAELAAGAAALELLQPTLRSPLQQLLVMWAVFLAREAAVQFASRGADAAACLSNVTPASRQLPCASGSSSSSTVRAAATAAVDQLSSLQRCLEDQQESVWRLLWSQLQLVRSCWRLQQQLLQQGTAVRQDNSFKQLWLLLAAVVLSVVALLVCAAGIGMVKQLQVLQLVTAAVLVLAAHPWGPRWFSNRRTQQSSDPQGQARTEGSTQPGFAVFSCWADVPGDLLVDQSPDPAASTLCYSAFACSDLAGAAPGSSGTQQTASSQQQPQQQQAGLLLCVLPQPLCEQQLQQVHSAAAGHTRDTASAQDQGSSQQHTARQGSSMAAAAAAEPTSGRVQLKQHPVVSLCGFGEELKPSAALCGALQPLQAALHQQQQARRLLVPIGWVCLDPAMMLQGVSAGSSLASWLLEQQQHQQGASAGPVEPLQQQQPQQPQQLQQQLQAEWTPPFPAAEWPQVLCWLQDVVAALQLLHMQGLVHGAVHAGSVHLSSSEGEQLRAQLSLAEPWFRGVTVVPAADPALSAPEVIGIVPVPVNNSSSLSSSSGGHPGGSTSKVCSQADVYGVGMLMWQLATGWVPQQAGSPAQAQAEVSWCAEMLERYGATFPGAAGAVAAGDFGWQDARCSSSSASRASSSCVGEGYEDARHGWLPSTADGGWLPEGYRPLMYRCCRPQASIRPSLTVVQQALQQLAR